MMRHWNSPAAVICLHWSKNTQSWCSRGGSQAKITPTYYSKVSLWWALWTMISNLNLVSPFNTHDETLEWSSCCQMGAGSLIHTQPWCEKWSPLPKYWPSTTQKSACGEHCGQWYPISTLSHHSLYSWWGIGRVKLLSNGCRTPNTHNLGGVNKSAGTTSHQIYPHPTLKSQLVVSIVDNDIQSQPCLIIHYTPDETLEWSSCCQIGAGSLTHTTLAWKVGTSHQNYPHPTLKS